MRFVDVLSLMSGEHLSSPAAGHAGARRYVEINVLSGLRVANDGRDGRAPGGG